MGIDFDFEDKILQIYSKWSSVPMNLPIALLEKAIQPTSLYVQLKGDEAAKKMMNLNWNENNRQEFLQVCSYSIDQIWFVANRAFFVGLDCCITKKISLVNDIESLKTFSFSTVPEKVQKIAIASGMPAIVALFHVNHLWGRLKMLGKSNLRKLDNYVIDEILTLIAWCFTYGMLEAKIKITEIPISYQETLHLLE